MSGKCTNFIYNLQTLFQFIQSNYVNIAKKQREYNFCVCLKKYFGNVARSFIFKYIIMIYYIKILLRPIELCIFLEPKLQILKLFNTFFFLNYNLLDFYEPDTVAAVNPMYFGFRIWLFILCTLLRNSYFYNDFFITAPQSVSLTSK